MFVATRLGLLNLRCRFVKNEDPIVDSVIDWDGEGSRTILQGRVVLGTTFAALLLLVLGGVLDWWVARLDVESLVVVGTSLILVGLGALIIRRANSDRVGWVFARVGLSILLSGVSGSPGRQS